MRSAFARRRMSRPAQSRGDLAKALFDEVGEFEEHLEMKD
jgi:hypothetical protein